MNSEPLPVWNVVEGDAFGYLRVSPTPAICTSLPDAADLGWEVAPWEDWFARSIRACLEALTPHGAAVFYQTDRRYGGRLISKPAIIFEEAEALGLGLLWHKIVCRRRLGAVDLYRPAYAHLVAVGHGPPGKASADVLAHMPPLYRGGMHPGAAGLAAEWFRSRGCSYLHDPFCGGGTTLLAALEQDMAAYGCDIDPRQCAKARALLAGQLTLGGTS